MIKVSIIITSYNYEKYIQECIDSCLNQVQYSEFEVIVVDDGSTDSTDSILQKINHPRFRYYKIKNAGIECASNFGIRKSKGEYIVRVDADDVLLPNYLVNILPELNGVSFVYSDYFIINELSEKIGQSSLPEFDKDEIFRRGDFLATGTLYKKKDIEEIGLYSEKNKNCGLENYELTINLLNKGKKGKKINKILFSYRRHKLNMSEKRRNSIINYGKKLFNQFENIEFMTNEFHPYQLKI